MMSGDVAATLEVYNQRRLVEIKAFASQHGFGALTGSDAYWLIEQVERLNEELAEWKAAHAARLRTA